MLIPVSRLPVNDDLTFRPDLCIFSDHRTSQENLTIINLTGGRAIEEKPLVRALRESWIAGAVVDAFAKQPLPKNSELWDLPNVIISPRIAGVTSEKWPALLPIFRDNLRRFIAGEPLRNLVNKELGY